MKYYRKKLYDGASIKKNDVNGNFYINSFDLVNMDSVDEHYNELFDSKIRYNMDVPVCVLINNYTDKSGSTTRYIVDVIFVIAGTKTVHDLKLAVLNNYIDNSEIIGWEIKDIIDADTGEIIFDSKVKQFIEQAIGHGYFDVKDVKYDWKVVLDAITELQEKTFSNKKVTDTKSVDYKIKFNKLELDAFDGDYKDNDYLTSFYTYDAEISTIISVQDKYLVPALIRFSGTSRGQDFYYQDLEGDFDEIINYNLDKAVYKDSNNKVTKPEELASIKEYIDDSDFEIYELLYDDEYASDMLKGAYFEAKEAQEDYDRHIAMLNREWERSR